MKLSQFLFTLPPASIASHPAANRDESRLMVLHKKTGAVEHMIFKGIVPHMKDNAVVQ